MAPGFTKIHTEMDSVDRSEDDEMEMPDESQSVDESDNDIEMITEVSYTILLQSFILLCHFVTLKSAAHLLLCIFSPTMFIAIFCCSLDYL